MYNLEPAEADKKFGISYLNGNGYIIAKQVNHFAIYDFFTSPYLGSLKDGFG